MDRFGIVTLTTGAVLLGVVAAGFLLPGRADAGPPRPPDPIPRAPPSTAWECTRFRVPESVNLSIRGSDGVLVNPPTSLGPSFRPLLTTVALPEGFEPFGGGDGSVIACKKGGR